MAKDTFIFYKSFYDALNIIKSAESKMRVIDAVCEYAFLGTDEKGKTLTAEEKIIFIMASPLLDATKKHYEDGKKGGRPSNAIQITTIKTPVLQGVKTNDNDNVKEKVNLNVNEEVNLKVNEKDKEEIDDLDNINISQSSIPLYADIKDFIAQQHLRVDAKLFFNYYQKRNWKNVKSWRKAILGWEDNLDEWDKTKEEADADEYAALWSK